MRAVSWGRDQHWWCVAPDETIVDPTVEQFIDVPMYEEIDLNNPEALRQIPTGVCMDCGDDVYEDQTFCSAACEKATLAYLNGRSCP